MKAMPNSDSAPTFLFVSDDAPNACAEERLSGSREPFPAYVPEWGEAPTHELYAFALRRTNRSMTRFPRRLPQFVALVGTHLHPLRPVADKPRRLRSLFVRKGNIVRLRHPLESCAAPAPSAAVVLHVRKWLALLPMLPLVLCLGMCAAGNAPQHPEQQFLEGQSAPQPAATSAESHVSYASYEATEDGVFKAERLEQHWRVGLPATVETADGVAPNPVLSSPSLYVDENADSAFEDAECVWNPPSDGGYGLMLQPGMELQKIELVRSLPAGEYAARTVWRSVYAEGGAPAGETSFDWRLRVE